MNNKVFNIIAVTIGIITAFLVLILYSYVLDANSFINNFFYVFNSVSAFFLFSFLMLMVATFIYVIIFSFRSNILKQYKILDMIPQAIIIYSLTGKVQFANRYACNKFEISCDKAVDENIINYLSEKDRGRALIDIKNYVKETYKGLGSDRKIAINDYTTVTKSGKEIISTIYIGSFSPTRLLTILVDNTELEASKQTYNEQSDFFWGLLNNMTHPLSYNDVNGDYIFANRAYLEMSGKEESEVLGKNISEVLSSKDLIMASKRRQYVIDSKKSINFEETMEFNNKQIITHIDMIPHILGDKLLGTFQSIVNITDIKRKDALLKKEVKLNKTLNKVSELMSNTNSNTIDKLIDESLLLIRNVFSVDRVYMIFEEENTDYVLKYENIEDGLKPYQNFILDVPPEQKKFYEKFLEKCNVIKANKVSISKYASLKLMRIFKALSMTEVSFPAMSVDEYNIIFGAVSVSRYKTWSNSEIEFLISAGRFILEAIGRVRQIESLKLSEETLDALIDNTDIGIAISNTVGVIYYSNERFNSIFDLGAKTTMPIIKKIASKSNIEKAITIFKEREYKGFAGGTIKVKHKKGFEFYAKIYSSRIDYEGSKAYLTTVVDVTEYMVENI